MRYHNIKVSVICYRWISNEFNSEYFIYLGVVCVFHTLVSGFFPAKTCSGAEWHHWLFCTCAVHWGYQCGIHDIKFLKWLRYILQIDRRLQLLHPLQWGWYLPGWPHLSRNQLRLFWLYIRYWKYNLTTFNCVGNNWQSVLYASGDRYCKELICGLPGECVDIIVGIQEVVTENQCIASCQGDSACEYWTFNPANGLCARYSNCTEIDLEGCPSCVYGEKLCPIVEKGEKFSPHTIEVSFPLSYNMKILISVVLPTALYIRPWGSRH